MSTPNLLAEFLVKSMLVREQFYTDNGRWEHLRNLYHPDSSKTKLKISWFEGDIEGFINGSKIMVTRGGKAFHNIQPVEVLFNVDKALAESTGTINLRVKHEGNEYECISYIKYVSRVQKASNEWKLLSLEVIYDRDTVFPVAPLIKPVTIDVDNLGARESYKCITWLLAQRGQEVNQHLTGTDRPDSIKKLMDESLSWLRE